MIQSSICRENTIALSFKHTPMHVRAHTLTHMHIETSSKKADPSKKKPYFKTLVFQARKLIIPRPDPFLWLPKRKRKSSLNFVWIHLSPKICQSNLRWGWKRKYFSLLPDSLFTFLSVGKRVKPLPGPFLSMHRVTTLEGACSLRAKRNHTSSPDSIYSIMRE